MLSRLARPLAFGAAIALAAVGPAAAQELPTPPKPRVSSAAPAAATVTKADSVAGARHESRQTLIVSITIFVLAIFVGFELINKVPATLHTPLMSGSNAISGITVVGAIIAAGAAAGVAPLLGFVATVLAMINVVGGFLVTHRMLRMFKRR
jgi:H+-translocating NAD(P) transhydrogenase subunit alpha